MTSGYLGRAPHTGMGLYILAGADCCGKMIQKNKAWSWQDSSLGTVLVLQIGEPEFDL